MKFTVFDGNLLQLVHLYANTVTKKPVTAEVLRQVTAEDSSNISNNELMLARSRLKPVQPPSSATKKTSTGGQQVEGAGNWTGSPGASQNHAAQQQVRECRRPSDDASAPAAVSESRVANGNVKSPAKEQRGAAVDSKSLVVCPPALPTRTRQPSPSPQPNAAKTPAAALEPRSGGGCGEQAKEPSVAGTRVDIGHRQLSKD